jgi:quercetin dioxygenase-like cupin family protein
MCATPKYGINAGSSAVLENTHWGVKIMQGKFIPAANAERERMDWGVLSWISRPQTTGAEQLVVIEVVLTPGCGHNFHKHAHQEEVIYVVAGAVEQWIGEEKRILQAGDGVFIGADVVHASFNDSASDAKIIAILGPCVGAEGYQLIDVAAESPWRDLR